MKLLTKIGPIITILACVAALYFANQLGTARDALRTERDQLNANLESTKSTLTQTTADLDETKTALQQSKNETLQVQAELDGAKVTVGQKEQQVTELEDKLGGLEDQMREANAKLQATEESMTKLQEVTESLEFKDLEELVTKLDAMKDENRMLGEKAAALDADNKRLIRELEDATITPADLRGRVALAQSMWNFVVLDIGQQDHVRKDTPFLVYRDSQLIAKARVTVVNQTSSVAEIMPEMSPGIPRAGDLAIPGEI
ncbi:hypothetical protein HQ590_11640 [bacterium]|nr:hypothetical protein [bacterium]